MGLCLLLLSWTFEPNKCVSSQFFFQWKIQKRFEFYCTLNERACFQCTFSLVLAPSIVCLCLYYYLHLFIPAFRLPIIDTCLPITTQGVRRQFFGADRVNTLIFPPFVSVKKSMKDRAALHEINHIGSTV